MNRAGRTIMMWGFVVVMAMTFSCATAPSETALAGLFDQFEKTPQVLIRAKNSFLRDLAASVDDATLNAFASLASSNQASKNQPIDRDRIDKTLTRADAVGIGISWEDTSKASLEAVFAGNFPSFLTSVSFFFDKNWTKIPGGYEAKSGKIYVRDPQGGSLHIATWTPEPQPSLSLSTSMLAKKGGLNQRNDDLAFYADAKSTLIAQIPLLEGVSLPFDGIAFHAERDPNLPAPGNPDASYKAIFQVQMNDEQAAKTYKPIIKLLWIFLSRTLVENGIPIPADTAIEQQGALFSTQPIAISAQQIADILISLSNLDTKSSGMITALK